MSVLGAPGQDRSTVVSNMSGTVHFEHAVRTLVERRRLSVLAASVALADAADTLGVPLADLAALVAAAPLDPTPGTGRVGALSVVASVTARPDCAWTLRGPWPDARRSWPRPPG